MTPERAGKLFLCECNARRCRRQLPLAEYIYLDVRRTGAVLHADCAERERRNVILRVGDVAVCVSALRRAA